MIHIIGDFEDFWILYDKKRSKKKASKMWGKLEYEDKEEIMRTLPTYIQSTPDKQFRKDPCTYLYNESWNDEIITNGRLTEAQEQYLISDTSI